MALDTKYKAERYRIVVKSTLKNVYYFEKKYGVGVERDTMSRHTELGVQCGQNFYEVTYCAY